MSAAKKTKDTTNAPVEDLVKDRTVFIGSSYGSQIQSQTAGSYAFAPDNSLCNTASMTPKEVKRLWHSRWFQLAVVLVVLIGLFALYGLSRQPWRFTHIVNTPGHDRTVPVYNGLTVGQRVTVTTNTVAGISFFVPAETQLLETPITLHVRIAGTDQNLRTIQQAVTTPTSLETILTGALRTEYLSGNVIHFPFAPLAVTPGTSIDFILEASSLSRSEAFELAFEIDDSKYVGGSALYNGQLKERDLGFIVYEQPRISTLVVRWLLDPTRRLALAGTILIAIGVIAYTWRVRSISERLIHTSLQEQWRGMPWSKIALLMGILLVVIFIVYSPALSMSFIQDDIQKLLRVRTFEFHRLIFTAERFQSPGDELLTPVAFWRPLSFGFYPLVLHTLFGLHPFPYYVASMLILAALGLCVLLLGKLVIRSLPIAFLATVVFLLHSTKTHTVYWWSSTEDTIGSLFMLMTVLAYVYWRAQPSSRRLSLLILIFIAAVGSKEHSVMALPLIALVEWAVTNSYLKSFKALVVGGRPLLLIAGLYLISRSLVLNWPTELPATQPDTSYDMKFAAQTLAINSVPYAAWTAENLFWPSFADPSWLEYRHHHLADQKPFYPGLVMLASYFVVLLLFWKSPYRRFIVFSGGWWLISLGPVLFLDGIWGTRWLTLAIAGLGWFLSILVLSKLKREWQWPVIILVVVLLLPHAYSMARLDRQLEPYRTLSRQGSEVVERVRAQQHRINENTTIYFVNVHHDTRGTVNAYLLRLHLPHVPFKTSVYSENIPKALGKDDLIIEL